jgi:hypothetical protein
MIRAVARTADLPWLQAWARVTLLLRDIRTTRWDEPTWPTAKVALGKALKMRADMRRRGWWN